MFDESFAVTVTPNDAPAVADAGPLTAKWVAAPGLTVTVCNPLTDVFATIGLVARLAGVEERGSELVRSLQARLDAMPQPAKRPRVAVIEWLSPLFAPGHWVPDQIELAGGESAFGTRGERSRESTWEALAAAEPEVIVLGRCGFDRERSLEEWAALDPPEALRSTHAWRSGELWAIDGSAYVSRPGPRLLDGIEVLAGILGDRAPVGAIRLAR